jgi:hypothetical protein
MPSMRSLLVAVFIVGAAGVPVAGPAAAALPTCDGSGTVHAAPYDCVQRRTIDGTIFRVRIHVPVSGGLRVRYSLDKPRSQPTEVRVQLRAGVNGPVSIDRGIQLASDATEAVFHLGNPCVVDGALELTVVLNNTLPDHPVAAPYVRRPLKPGCAA